MTSTFITLTLMRGSVRSRIVKGMGAKLLEVVDKSLEQILWTVQKLMLALFVHMKVLTM